MAIPLVQKPEREHRSRRWQGKGHPTYARPLGDRELADKVAFRSRGVAIGEPPHVVTGRSALSPRRGMSDGVAMTVHISTESVPVRDRAAFFADALAQAYLRNAITIPEGPRPFSASLTSDRLGPLQVSNLLAEPYQVSRTRRMISHDPDEYVFIGLQRRGASAFLQDGRDAISLRPGDFTLFATSIPVTAQYGESLEIATFVLPRRALAVPDSDLYRITGSVVRGDEGLGRLMSSFLSRIVDTADSYTPEAGEEVARNATALFATLTAERLGHDRFDVDAAQRVLHLRVRSFINRHLADPGLSAESIARAHHVSTRHVQRLFQRQGTTVGRWILRRRLEECHRELGRSGPRVPAVGEVARRWGFTSAAHFSHAFRAAYGVSPREWRAISHSGDFPGRRQEAPPPGRAQSEPGVPRPSRGGQQA